MGLEFTDILKQSDIVDVLAGWICSRVYSPQRYILCIMQERSYCYELNV